ncbi:hypothetical protein QFC22_001408 [Naganishia vaughanmartiniae]|uniref:Uncharacterized protein n=1 Tax=Naganishia vaughanmartiniae TaxID=1424756 RepID=A0ACC2XIF7_9TREE|nr:hypothetical protein QFC22_001408 [Naganishia vaughanmartiniae]
MNSLRRAPFTTIEGVNPDDPISAQMEKIDQLNTLLLQEIDENFAKFHQVVTSQVLPEVKRFALASEPTREAATFWRSFFERAASVKLNTQGEYTNTTALSEDAYGHSQHEGPHRQKHEEGKSYSRDDYEYEDHEQTMERSGIEEHGYRYATAEDDGMEGQEDLSITSEDHSFLYGDQPMASSTPRASKTKKSNLANTHNPRYSDQSSVTEETDQSFFQQTDKGQGRSHPRHMDNNDLSLTSIHASENLQIDDAPSPFEQLDRRMREGLVLDDHGANQRRTSDDQDQESADQTITRYQRGNDDEPYEEEVSVVLRPDRTAGQSRGTPRRATDGRLGHNEIGSPGWNGIADLRTTPLNVKVKRHLPTSTISKPAYNLPRAGPSAKAPSRPQGNDIQPSDLTADSVSSSSFGITNMSPPVTTNFGNTITRRNLEKTPAKEAVKLVIDDLMRGIGGGFSPSPVMEADAAFAKYGYGLDGIGEARGTPSKSMGKRGQMLDQLSRRGEERHAGPQAIDEEKDNYTAALHHRQLDDSRNRGPDTSTVGMARERYKGGADASYTYDAQSLLEESFAGAGGDDSLEVDRHMQLPEGYDDPTILLDGRPYQPDHGQQHIPSPSPAHHGKEHHYRNDLLDAETTVDADTYHAGPRDQPTATLNTMMTTQSDLLRFSPAASDVASVFGGSKYPHGQTGRSGGFALLGADDIHTFHGGVSLNLSLASFRYEDIDIPAPRHLTRSVWKMPAPAPELPHRTL